MAIPNVLINPSLEISLIKNQSEQLSLELLPIEMQLAIFSFLSLREMAQKVAALNKYFKKNFCFDKRLFSLFSL